MRQAKRLRAARDVPALLGVAIDVAPKCANMLARADSGGGISVPGIFPRCQPVCFLARYPWSVHRILSLPV